MTTSTRGCVVLVPVGSHVEPACEEGLRDLESRGFEVRRVRGYSAIDQGRCQMASDALADGFEATFWIDTDIGFEADDVERLLAHDAPIVAATYPQKGRRALTCHVLPGTEQLVFGEQGGLTEVLYVGTGFLLVRREVYETMQQRLELPICNERFDGRPLVPYFLPMLREDGAGHWYLAEDFAFCERARRCGYHIMLDTTIRLQHFGGYGYSWEDAGSAVDRYKTYHYRIGK
ncbi:MAG: hypothetical protein O3C40_13720 [Planctomycetota bacterium]|nr:hypothetical protein [Planctomycetota bacterium]